MGGGAGQTSRGQGILSSVCSQAHQYQLHILGRPRETQPQREFSVSIWEGKSEDVDVCLAGKLRTLEACAFTCSFSWSWKVQKLGHHQSCCKLVFSFMTTCTSGIEIVKEYHFGITGTIWLPGWCEYVWDGVDAPLT